MSLIGVVVMAYGTPASLDDVEAYLTHIMGGRTPSAEAVADLRRRYQAIGGVSPLLAIARAQADGLQRALGDGYRVVLGMKHAPPFIEDAVCDLGDVERILSLVLAPHHSEAGSAEYHRRVKTVAPAPVDVIESWHLEPGLVDLWAQRVRGAPGKVVFTAHSVPGDDPRYRREVHETAAAVAAAAGLDDWAVAYQSGGRTPGAWLGPDVNDVAHGALVAPIGFVSDHLEILYDLKDFDRAPSLNDDPGLIEVLAKVVRR